MKILITGASGFIGSRLVQAACSHYGSKEVIALSSRPNTACETIIYDKNDFGINQTDLAKLATVEVLIHAGAYTPKTAAGVNAISECNANIVFTDKLLRFPFVKLKKIINLSTIDVYALDDQVTELTQTLPQTLYGMSKLYCERLISIYAEKEKVACQILRIGHVYGPGEERYAKFLPKTLQNIIKGNPVELWGDGAELRSFIFIDDVVKAILTAISLPPDTGIINVVGGTVISIRQLLDAVIAISGKSVNVESREFKGLKKDYVFNNEKCRTCLLSIETDLLAGLRAEYIHCEGLS